MVERLDGQRRRLVLAEAAHAFLRDAGAHLHQAVEAASAGPGSAPAIGVERHVDEAGPRAAAFDLAEAERVERAGPIAMDDDIGLAEQGEETLAAAGVGEVEPRAAFASVTSGATLGSSQSGGSMRNTSAP